ncbi:MAG: hypothetical protein K1X47_11090 [Cyclobacteriaceae bacterium]|nr:hypothetical protein [Cyclobacteriaceae bacterium]
MIKDETSVKGRRFLVVLAGALGLMGLLFLVYSVDRHQEAQRAADELMNFRSQCEIQSAALAKEVEQLKRELAAATAQQQGSN